MISYVHHAHINLYIAIQNKINIATIERIEVCTHIDGQCDNEIKCLVAKLLISE